MMIWIELHPVMVSLMTFAFGGFIAFLTNYLFIYLRFSSDIAFIKGQLSQLLESHSKIDDIIENHAKIEAEFQFIKKQLLNGGYA